MVQRLVVAPSDRSGPPQAAKAVAMTATDAKREKRNSNLAFMGAPLDSLGRAESGLRLGRGRRDRAHQTLVLGMRVDQRGERVGGRDEPREQQASRERPFTDRLHGFRLPSLGRRRASGVPGAEA